MKKWHKDNTHKTSKNITIRLVFGAFTLWGAQISQASQPLATIHEIKLQEVQSKTCVACEATYITTKDYVALVTARRFVKQLQLSVKKLPLTKDQDDIEAAAGVFSLFSADNKDLSSEELNADGFYIVSWSENTPSWRKVNFKTYINEWARYLSGDFVNFFNEEGDLYLVVKNPSNPSKFQIFITKYLIKDGNKGFYLNPRRNNESIKNSLIFKDNWLVNLQQRLI